MESDKKVCLQLVTYNDEECVYIDFEVPETWLLKQIEEEYQTLQEFLDVYTSDESQPIYDKAILEGLVQEIDMW